jgi:hypothetical protein
MIPRMNRSRGKNEPTDCPEFAVRAEALPAVFLTAAGEQHLP